MATTSLGISSSTAVFPSQKIVDGALPSSSSSLLPRPLMSKRKWHSTSWGASWSTRATFSRPSSSFSEGGRQQCVEGSSSSGSAIAMHYKNASAAAVDRGVRPLVTDPAASDAAAACGLFEGADEPSSCTDGGEPSFVVAEFGGSSPKLLHVAVDVDEGIALFYTERNDSTADRIAVFLCFSSFFFTYFPLKRLVQFGAVLIQLPYVAQCEEV